MSTRNRTSAAPPPTKKFELPALPLDNFGSLTDGTDIPPPEREPTPPPFVEPASVPLPASSSASAINGSTNGTGNARKPSQISITGTERSGTPNGTGEGMLSPVMSPTSPNRPPSSMKRFLSRKSMNASYTVDGQSQSQSRVSNSNSHSDLPYQGPARPDSSLSFVSSGGTKSKKKRSWWMKLMGVSNADEDNGSGKGGNGNGNGTTVHRKRTSTVLEGNEPREVQRKKAVATGPPPPKLPELRGVSREGKADGGFGGDDMFSNIR